MIALALESRVFDDLEHGDEVPGRTVARPGHSLSANREVMMVGDAGRHVQLHRLLGFDPSLPTTRLARLSNHPTITTAGRARRHRDELPEHRLRRAPHFSRAAAGAAGDRLGAGLGAASFAGWAGVECAQLDCLGRAG